MNAFYCPRCCQMHETACPIEDKVMNALNRIRLKARERRKEFAIKRAATEARKPYRDD